MEFLGWIGGILLAFCGIPEVISTVRNKRCNLSHGFIWMWFLGELFVFIPVLKNSLGDYLIFNYLFNIILISVLIYYKYRRDK